LSSLIERRGLTFALLLVAASVPRILQALTEPAYLHPDALFQGLEPAFSLVWGHGITTWEFEAGLRSWVWPGVLAIPMYVARALGWAGPGLGMESAIVGARLVVAAIDVFTVLMATRLALALGGHVAALLCATMLALHPAFFVMGAQPLIDVPAAALLVWSCERAFSAKVLDRRRAVGLGVGAALVPLVRVQLTPAVLVLAVMLVWRTRRGATEWTPGARMALLLSAIAVVCSWGIVDATTLGAPFAATARYLSFNLGAGQTAFGVMPANRYARDFLEALGWMGPVLVACTMAGLRRTTPLALIMLAVVVPHQALSYRVWRFLHPALPLLVILAGVGLGTLMERLSGMRPRWRAGLLAGVTGLGLLEIRAALGREAPWATTWLFAHGGMDIVERSRALNLAYLELSAHRSPRRVAQAVLPAAASPGYALLGHDIPVSPVLDAGLDPLHATEVDVWVVPLPLGPTDPELELVWSDALGVVGILRRDRH
jgi:GPI mannosyltransferase 3